MQKTLLLAQHHERSSDLFPMRDESSGASSARDVDKDMTAAVEHDQPKGLPQLRFETFPSQVFWLAVVFVVLYVVLSRKTLPRIQSVLETRQKKIAADLDQAEHAQIQANDARATYEQALAEARQHAQTVMSGVQESMKKRAAIANAEMDAALHAKAREVDEKLTEARIRAFASAEQSALSLAASIVEKITHAPVSETELQSAHPKRAA